MDVGDMIKDEDLLIQKGQLHMNGMHHRPYSSQSGQHIQQLVSNMVPNFYPKRLSARELNLLKRKAKVNAKDHPKGHSEDDDDVSSFQNTTSKPMITDIGLNKDFMDAVIDDGDNVEQDGCGGWPFFNFVEQLIHDMFDPIWEVRHGAIMALREILTHQGGCAGVFLPDLRLESKIVDAECKDQLNSLKREREIDLNIQLLANDSEPNSKRLKDESRILERSHDTSDMMSLGIQIKSECDLGNETSSMINDELHCRYANLELGSCVDDTSLELKHEAHGVESKDLVEQSISLSKTNLLAHIPESSKLMRLIKFMRHSWIKNWEFLQDCAIRFLCILSLDRFGDYVSDQVVAPVRETCAQALGAALKYMHPSLVHETLKVLLQMQRRQEWEVRHGCLLGIKYMVAVRKEMLDDLLGCILPSCKVGLEDPDDDVRAVAAESLIPTAGAIVTLQSQALHSIVMLLWDILLDLDDLSPSTSSVMNLLAEIYSHPEMLPKMLGEGNAVEKEFDLNESIQVDEQGQDLQAAATLYFSSWVQLVATPYGSPLDSTKMFWPVALPRKSHFRAAAKIRAAKLDNEYQRNLVCDSAKEAQETSGDVSANFTKIIVGADSERSVTRTRVVTATALGIFASRLPETSLQLVIDPLWNDLKASSGVQRQVASMVLMAWFKELRVADAPGVLESMMRNEATLLLSAVDSSSIFKNVLLNVSLNVDALNVDDAISFASTLSLPNDHNSGDETNERQTSDDIELSKQRLLSTSGYLKCVQSNLHITVSALVAAAVVWMSELPSKLNPIILPLMAAVKREQEEILQQKAAEALAELIFRCISRKPSPNDKLIKNLCSLTCMDPCETPQAALLNSVEMIEDQDLLSFGKSTSGQKTKIHMLSPGEDRSKLEGFISRRGSELALKHLCEKFGGALFERLPKLWECLTEVLRPCIPGEDQVMSIIDNIKDPQIIINNMQILRSLAPMLDVSLEPNLLTLLPCIIGCVRHYHVAVRLAASRCLTTMAKAMTTSVMGILIEKAIPMLGDSSSVHARQGAGMLVSLLVKGLGVELVPYAPYLVVPLLRCMSDCDHAVRQSVTRSFASLVPLLPLARGLPPPTGLSDSLSRSAEDSQFLEQLLDNSHIDDYKLFTDLKVTLRRYQQEGINWLSFLKRFKLHGILCDDMGLGKTLQASAIVASDIAERRGCKDEKDPLSLIICPSTLVGHWEYEIEKFIDILIMTPLQYVGSAQERASLRKQFEKYNVIITSYDVVRKDIDHLGQINWNYCILDEGHIIKNSRSKITGAVKQLKAEHRLILSGTPIQNNVLELWSLFDFLMPGFLGTERQFQATYGKPLVAAKDSKCSAKDAEAGALAMEALHKQVMPFLLRRTKAEVLSDLPEKIIQDRYCDLSPIQLKLYEQFSGPDARKEISNLDEVNGTDTVEGTGPSPRASVHVFQALQYLLKLCSHPLLVLGEKPPESIFPGCADIVSELHEIHHSPKLVALQEILEECGIGVDLGSDSAAATVGEHRVLIFAQHRSFLDIIEKDLFQARMKSVTYLRLDGSVEPEKRFEIVKAFNSDPTIDVLLLTTHVGGLGLNLTSADTIVFVEHDWNPMKDHQAMDRAHRLGQRKVVNVHRLIMRGTLEEKVMSLQKFKVSVANAIINAENASLKTMNTDQLLDLFASAPTTKKGAIHSSNPDGDADVESKVTPGGKGLKAILSGLGDLWDQSQYADEYNLDQFLSKLNKA
ncbi:Chromatin structure-remodeling complex protein SYD [Acorus calamus]|uniref:Chromatin structure-remodeling complex protein SYD n=1 Tax=Acorus calamus TaxID=4465 RepID=A0AAV9CFH9_ACOCL|nr:Chromatin structure-remodeling complex protein SYD [Acorus calamus]